MSETKVIDETKTGYLIPEFKGENIPVTVAAKIMHKDQQFIRQAMIQGLLPIGLAFKKEGSTQYDFYISPRLFWEYTGFYYNPDEENCNSSAFRLT